MKKRKKDQKKDITHRQFIWTLFLAWAIVAIGIALIVLAPIVSK